MIQQRLFVCNVNNFLMLVFPSPYVSIVRFSCTHGAFHRNSSSSGYIRSFDYNRRLFLNQINLVFFLMVREYSEVFNK